MAAHKYYSHYANGYYWVAWDNGGIGCSFYSSRDGVTWTSQGAIFTSINPNSFNNEWAVRYLGTTVIAAAFNGTNSRTYRSGTLNGDGTVSWSAESAAGAADASFNALNLLIANGRPIMWRDDATAGGAGAIWRGSAIASPTWTKTAANAPAMSTGGVSSGIFTAGALFQTGGANANDLIVLRATTVTPYAAGNHRLLAMKWNSATDTYDASWYNVSTLGGTIAGGESATTEVQVNSDQNAQKRFAAVRDTSGNLHAVYINRNGDIVHYEKAVGFNDSWSRVSAGITGVATVNMVSLTAAAGGNLYLFYSKGDKIIYYRRFDGTAWGAESLLQDVSATALRGALAPMETAVGNCALGLAFIEGTASPYNIRFTTGVGSCSSLTTTEAATTVTVDGPGSFEMVFDKLHGGSLTNFYDLAEDPTRLYDLAGKPSVNFYGLFHSSIISSGTLYVTGTNNIGAKLDLLEATPTRVRVRQEAFYQTVPAATNLLAGVKGIGDYSVYPERVAVQWNRRTTASLPQSDHPLEISSRREIAPDPRNNVTLYTQSGTVFPAPGGDDFVLAQHDTPGVRTDILAIQYTDWAAADTLTVSTTGSYFSWRDNGPIVSPIPAGTSEKWDFLIYYKPTTFLGNVDPAVTSRSSDFRGPSAITTLVGGPWQLASENTSPGDDFNEAEAAYPLTLDPALGLTFRIDGSAATPRYHPFFKIRQWRSLFGPPSVTLQGLPLAAGVDYRADVKPISRAHFARQILWHSTLQDLAASLTNPDIGTAGSALGATAVAARYGNGLQVQPGNSYIDFSTVDFDPALGAVEFWYQPDYASNDAANHYLAGFQKNPNNQFFLLKAADNNLYFTITAGGTTSTYTVAAANFSWRAADWVHLRMEWNDGVACTPSCVGQQRIVINGVEPPHTDSSVDYVSANLTVDTLFKIGGVLNSNNGSTGLPGSIYDEVYSYGSGGPGGSTTPAQLAEGGLTGAATEYLADPAKNYSLALGGVDATRRGVYLYLGADSQFHGLNVTLATAGAGVAAGALVWEYWNGAAWTDLESGTGFTDTTGDFTKNGNVFWTGDPFGWAPYSMKGGPDLYYVRVHLPNAVNYSTVPVESQIRTDILLFQYCGDITAAAQQFVFSPPVPTLVTLASFGATPLDGAVELQWTTASELRNLGFYIHRAPTASGPWTRVTSSLIPGLGSSPIGRSYSFQDGGLANGVRYFYELEDVDASGVSSLHGPVSAMPVAGATAPGVATDAAPPATTTSGGSGGTTRRFGDPDAVDLQVLRRTNAGVLLELQTGGFYATSDPASGLLRVTIPSFDAAPDPEGPALPLRRALIDAAVGRRARIAAVQSLDLVAFPGLVPEAEGFAEMEVKTDGTVRAQRRTAPLRASLGSLLPEEPARLAAEAFLGDEKKLVVELAPLRFDPRGKRLILARRLRVLIDFGSRERRERGSGTRGRREPASARAVTASPLAYIHVAGAGLQALAFEELFPARRGSVPLSSLKLSRAGVAVPFHVEPSGAAFGPRGVLLFYAPSAAASTAFTGEVGYTLSFASDGLQMADASASPAGPAAPSFALAGFETNRIYQPGLLDAPDPWLWDVLFAGASKTFPFALAGALTSSPLSARLSVALQGASDPDGSPDHCVQALVNGALVGERCFDGRLPASLEAEIAPSLLRQGTNELQLTSVGGAASLVFLDRFSLAYPQSSRARAGRFDGTWAASGTGEVAGLPAPPLALVETAGNDVRWLRGAQWTGGVLRLRAEAGRRTLVGAADAIPHPRVSFPAPVPWSEATQADYVVIAPGAFMGPAERLAERRQSQGLTTLAVSLESLGEQFGDGEPSAEAIHSFLAYAFQHFAPPSPRYVLLLGGSTYDPRNFLGSSQPSPLPALFVRTSYLWTVSDPTLAAVNGDDVLPDLALGRLPARSLAQAEQLVDKLLAWEDGAHTLDGRAALVADNPDEAGDFEANQRDIQQSFLSGRESELLLLRELGAGLRPAILEAFDQGASLISYVGHGGSAVWASENVLNSWDAAALLPQSRQPLLLTMDCLNGYFLAPSFDSIAEAFLKAAGRGSIAGFSPSGLSLDAPAHVYHRALVRELVLGHHERLGDALVAAQRAYAEAGAMPELLSVYHLLGDPATRIE